jgi:putative endonuclease
MHTTTVSTGRLGEAVAAEFMRSKGYEIIETNYERPSGEIDIISQKEQLVFIEVKAVNCRIPQDIPREGDNAHRPEENVSKAKRQRLRRITQLYLDAEMKGDSSWRFDLLCVYMDEGHNTARVKWLRNIII